MRPRPRRPHPIGCHVSVWFSYGIGPAKAFTHFQQNCLECFDVGTALPPTPQKRQQARCCSAADNDGAFTTQVGPVLEPTDYSSHFSRRKGVRKSVESTVRRRRHNARLQCRQQPGLRGGRLLGSIRVKLLYALPNRDQALGYKINYGGHSAPAATGPRARPPRHSA